MEDFHKWGREQAEKSTPLLNEKFSKIVLKGLKDIQVDPDRKQDHSFTEQEFILNLSPSWGLNHSSQGKKALPCPEGGASPALYSSLISCSLQAEPAL